MSKKMLKDYRINSNTMAVIPVLIEGERVISKVYEKEDVFYVPFRPINIIEKSCLHFGSSLSGRKEGTKEMTGISHKSPIAICPVNKIYFFPTQAYSQTMCAWFSHRYILKVTPRKRKQCAVYLGKKIRLSLPVSTNVLENQMYRTAQLRSAFENRNFKSIPRKFIEIEQIEIREKDTHYKDISDSDTEDFDPFAVF